MTTFATVNGVGLHYRLARAAAAPTIVFINSLGTDFRIWDGVADRLAGRFTMLFWDKRGHGLSTLGPGAHRIETHASDLRALMDHLRIGRATICGLSIGGLIAQALWRDTPERIERLLLCGTALKIGTPGNWNERIDVVNAGGIEPLADGIMQKWFTADFHRDRPDELAGYRTMLSRQDPAAYAAACAAIRDCDFSDSSRSINVPTLCLVGDGDGSTPPALVRSLADTVPGARYEVISAAGHIPCVEQPQRMAELIADFVQGHEGDR